MLYTVGYSSFSNVEEFLEVLKREKITLVVDVRSFPFSKNFSSFNKNMLKIILKKSGISYIFRGNNLGGEIVRKEVIKGIKEINDLLKNQKFRKGMIDLFLLSKQERTAILCSEKNPEECHRFLSIGYLFKEKANYTILNIIGQEVLTFDEVLDKIKQNPKLQNIENKYLIKQMLLYVYKVKKKKEVNFEGIYNRLF